MARRSKHQCHVTGWKCHKGHHVTGCSQHTGVHKCCIKWLPDYVYEIQMEFLFWRGFYSQDISQHMWKYSQIWEHKNLNDWRSRHGRKRLLIRCWTWWAGMCPWLSPNLNRKAAHLAQRIIMLTVRFLVLFCPCMSIWGGFFKEFLNV